MNRKIVIFLVLAVSAAGLFFIFHLSQGTEHLSTSAGAEGVEAFNGALPFLNIVFEYPKSWKIFVSRARSAEESTAQLIGPRDARHQFSTSFAVIGKKITGAVSLQDEEEKFIKRNKALSQFKVASKETVRVAGQDARRIAFDFSMNLPVDVQNAPEVIMREEVILLMRAGLLYQVHFIGTLEQHQRNRSLFEKFLKSIRFKD